jgi:NDP-sugar pyrophosphorylase family protein
MPDLLEKLRGEGHDVNCFKQNCYWLDIGRHDDYESANSIFEARRAEFLGTSAPTDHGPHLFRIRDNIRTHVGHER